MSRIYQSKKDVDRSNGDCWFYNDSLFSITINYADDKYDYHKYSKESGNYTYLGSLDDYDLTFFEDYLKENGGVE